MTEKSKKKKNWLVVVLVVLVLLALAAVGIMGVMLMHKGNEQPKAVGGQREAAAIQGTITQMTEEESQAALNQIVDEGMFRIHISANIAADTDGNAAVNIENNLQNRYMMQVTIYVDQVNAFGRVTEKEIYRTGNILPGYYIDNTVLDTKLPAGEYSGKAVFTALYSDTEEVVGSVAAQVTVTVKEPGEGEAGGE